MRQPIALNREHRLGEAGLRATLRVSINGLSHRREQNSGQKIPTTLHADFSSIPVCARGEPARVWQLSKRDIGRENVHAESEIPFKKSCHADEAPTQFLRGLTDRRRRWRPSDCG